MVSCAAAAPSVPEIEEATLLEEISPRVWQTDQRGLIPIEWFWEEDRSDVRTGARVRVEITRAGGKTWYIARLI